MQDMRWGENMVCAWYGSLSFFVLQPPSPSSICHVPFIWKDVIFSPVSFGGTQRLPSVSDATIRKQEWQSFGEDLPTPPPSLHRCIWWRKIWKIIVGTSFPRLPLYAFVRWKGVGSLWPFSISTTEAMVGSITKSARASRFPLERLIQSASPFLGIFHPRMALFDFVSIGNRKNQPCVSAWEAIFIAFNLQSGFI